MTTEQTSNDKNGNGQQAFIGRTIITLCILVLWYVSTSACNIASKLFIEASGPQLFLESALTVLNLSMIQLLWGTFLGALSTGRITTVIDLIRLDKMISELPEGFIWFNPTKNTQVFSAICHAIGGFALNCCYLYSSVFIVQVLKSAEPVATLSLGVIILGEKPTIDLICSVLTIISGVAMVCFRDSTISVAPVMIAMLSNFVLPMRNVLSKKIMMSTADTVNAGTENEKLLRGSSEHGGDTPDILPQKKNKSDGNPAESFFLTSLFASYFLFPFWLLAGIADYSFIPIIYSKNALMYVLLSGLMHAMYNLSSFGFLSRVSTPTTHAIANVFKRVFTIWTAVVFFGSTDSTLSPLSIAGLVLSTIGLFWYGSITANTAYMRVSIECIAYSCLTQKDNMLFIQLRCPLASFRTKSKKMSSMKL